MPVPTIDRPVNGLRQRMIEDMAMRGLRSDTQHEYICFVRSFAAFLRQTPDTTTAESYTRKLPAVLSVEEAGQLPKRHQASNTRPSLAPPMAPAYAFRKWPASRSMISTARAC
jgi:hypothetical protein